MIMVEIDYSSISRISRVRDHLTYFLRYGGPLLGCSITSLDDEI